MFNFFSQQKSTQKVPDVNVQSSAPIGDGIVPIVLLILDGWGIAPDSAGNAISLAKTPNMDKYMASYPTGELIAAGESVGLPANEAGNSEIGHLTLGAGRVMLQSLKRIDAAIKDGRFFENDALIAAINRARTNNTRLHLMGMIGTGGVHSSIEHMWAIIELCRQQKFTNVYLHLFTDGRDSPPQEALGVMEQIETKLKDLGVGRVATVAGRYFAMDRDRRWERTEKAYKAIVLGQGLSANSAVEGIKAAYERKVTDEFIEPFIVITPQGKPTATIADGDSVIFFNFRIDRPRQLTMALTLPDFENLKGFEFADDPYKEKYDMRGGKEVFSGTTFKRDKWPQKLFFVTMTEYQKGLPVQGIAFPFETVTDSLPEVISKQNLKQLHLAESEKERMVTYYFNGIKEEKYNNEDVVIVSSSKVATYDKRPEMSAKEILAQFKQAIEKGTYHFMVVNFANPDMVAHTGNLAATIKAVEVVDGVVGEIVAMVSLRRGTVVITSDHGNAEELLNFPKDSFFYVTGKGETNTEHSNNPVPIVIVSPKYVGQAIRMPRGTFSDVAPTILNLMGLPVPTSMTGRNLLQ